jgi:hypothetical protein
MQQSRKLEVQDLCISEPPRCNLLKLVSQRASCRPMHRRAIAAPRNCKPADAQSSGFGERKIDRNDEVGPHRRTARIKQSNPIIPPT